jgi:hypothetical protein
MAPQLPPTLKGGKLPQLPLQAGGARMTADGTVNAPDVLLGLIFVVGIAQAHQFPEDLLRFTDTLLGRALLFALTIAFTVWKGWTIGLLFALLSARLIQHTGRADEITAARYEAPLQEAFGDAEAPDEDSSVLPLVFSDSMTIQPIEKKKHKWFIERVLKENPIRIETDKVRTMPVQGK